MIWKKEMKFLSFAQPLRINAGLRRLAVKQNKSWFPDFGNYTFILLKAFATISYICIWFNVYLPIAVETASNEYITTVETEFI